MIFNACMHLSLPRNTFLRLLCTGCGCGYSTLVWRNSAYIRCLTGFPTSMRGCQAYSYFAKPLFNSGFIIGGTACFLGSKRYSPFNWASSEGTLMRLTVYMLTACLLSSFSHFWNGNHMHCSPLVESILNKTKVQNDWRNKHFQCILVFYASDKNAVHFLLSISWWAYHVAVVGMINLYILNRFKESVKCCFMIKIYRVE